MGYRLKVCAFLCVQYHLLNIQVILDAQNSYAVTGYFAHSMQCYAFEPGFDGGGDIDFNPGFLNVSSCFRARRMRYSIRWNSFRRNAPPSLNLSRITPCQVWVMPCILRVSAHRQSEKPERVQTSCSARGFVRTTLKNSLYNDNTCFCIPDRARIRCKPFGDPSPTRQPSCG